VANNATVDTLSFAAAVHDFPVWIRVTHFLNFLFVMLLIRSGIEILSSHPRLYLNDGCTPGSEWLKFTKVKVPTDPDVIYTAREDEVDASSIIALPGHKNLGIGRHWHGVSNTLWILTGAVYIVLLFATGEWSRLIPTSWQVFPDAWHSFTTYASLHAPPLSDFHPYDALQQLTYAGVVFLLGPFMLVTGAAMSPAIAASFPWYIKALGGRQVARSLHFLGLLAFSIFLVIHVLLVLLVHPRQNVSNITLGGPTQKFGLAVAIFVVGILLVVAINVAATIWSLRNRRQVQVALDKIEQPVRMLALHNLSPGQHYRESDISPYLWINGAPPKPDESPEHAALAAGGYRDWVLEVGGLVEESLALSLEDLRSLPSQTQITKHNCVQGWSGVGKWKGVRLSEILERCRPMPEARYVMFVSYGKAQYTYGDKPLQPFYEVIDLILARHRQTILAYDLNDSPLPLRHGAPLRLRVETQLGYKMVKYLRRIELISDYRTVGEGQGGSREDTQFFGRGAEI
jgi:methionine sulfoxide reductase catalytic subunit